MASEWVPRGKHASERPRPSADEVLPSREIRLTSHDESKSSAGSVTLQWLPVRSSGELESPKVLVDSRPVLESPRSVPAFSEEQGNAVNIAVTLEAPVIDPNGGDSDDPLQDPFGDLARPEPGTVPYQLLPLPSSSQAGEQALGSGQLELVPPPPPLPSQQKSAESGSQPESITTERQVTPENSKTTKTPQELLEGIPPATVDQRPLEEQLAQAPPLKPDECPPFGRMRKIAEITNNIAAKPGKLPTECPLEGGEFTPRQWEPIVFTWKASGLCHKPLYFEQVAVERYGHTMGPILQHLAAGAHFYLTIPILPYKMGLEPPDECIYPLGHYRPGSCAPWILDPIPLSVRAGLAEGGIWTGMVFLIP